jgi:hypothetical protein
MPQEHDQLTVPEIRGPYVQLLTNLQGDKPREWLAALKLFLSKKNPWPGGMSFSITPSVQAALNTLEGLRSQGHIPTMSWNEVVAEPIDNNGNYSDANRTMTFTLENGQMVELKVSTRKRSLGEVVRGDEGRKWACYLVFFQNAGKMKCLVNGVGNSPWYRQPMSDKPLPATIWRTPTFEEVTAYLAAVQSHDGDAFLKVYYADFIDWNELNDSLGKDTHWAREILKTVA